MKILLLGKNGQVGWELQRALAPLGQVVALDRDGDGVLCGNLADLFGLSETIRQVAPDVMVNAAAYTAVDRAELEPDLAKTINAEAVSVLADEAKALGALLVHYSTDYVFSGGGDAPWKESDATGPLSVYGQTKLAGEEAIVASGCAHLIFRTSWVYAARGHNFIKTMLRLGKEREKLAIVGDQVGAPTGAELIADATVHAIRSTLSDPALGGVYHLVSAGETTWHGFAEYLFEVARAQGLELQVSEVAAIPTADYPTPAARPLNSRLDTGKTCKAFALTMPDWKLGVTRVLEELLEQAR